MSIAIKFGDLTDPLQLSGLIFLDATTSYNKMYGGSVTSHPVETGVSISDHFVSNNPKFQIGGVISGVDISPIPSSILIEGATPLNSNPPPTPTTISDLGAGLSRFVPDIISQFLPSTSGSVFMDGDRQDHKESVEVLLETIMNGVFLNEERNRYENRMTLSTIYEMSGSQIGRSYNNCVLVGYSVREDPESGEGLFIDLTFEQVRFATSESAEAPAPRKGTETSRATEPTKNKGTAETEEVVDPVETLQEPTIFSLGE